MKVFILWWAAALAATAACCADEDQAPAPECSVVSTVPENSSVAGNLEPHDERPDWKIRTRVYLKKLFGPQAFYETVPGAISDHARNFPHQWGRSGSGFLKRTGSQYGQFILSTTIEAGVQAIHKEDPRYLRSGEGGVWRRTRYAVVNSFLARKPSGGRTVALSLPAGVYGSWAVATRWSPSDLQTPWKIVEWGTVGMGIKVSANLFREFWPDVKRRLFHK